MSTGLRQGTRLKGTSGSPCLNEESAIRSTGQCQLPNVFLKYVVLRRQIRDCQRVVKSTGGSKEEATNPKASKEGGIRFTLGIEGAVGARPVPRMEGHSAGAMLQRCGGRSGEGGSVGRGRQSRSGRTSGSLEGGAAGKDRHTHGVECPGGLASRAGRGSRGGVLPEVVCGQWGQVQQAVGFNRQSRDQNGSKTSCPLNLLHAAHPWNRTSSELHNGP